MARTQALIENLDRALALGGSDLTVESLTADSGITATTGGVTATAGGITVTAGNAAFRANHPVIKHQGAEATLNDGTAVIGHADVKAQILKCTPTGARSKATDTASNFISNLSLSVDGDSVDFFVINLSTTASHIITITGGTGMTLVGSMKVNPHVAGEDTSGSARFRLRRTGGSAATLYRLG